MHYKQNTMRILLVEDNTDLCASLYDYLESKGELIDCAYDGLAGLELFKQNEYDLIVLDINLPKLNGIALCERIRDLESTPTPIIMLTARSELETKLACFSLGADDYLVKPFEMAELHARAHTLAKRYSNPKKILTVGDLTYNTGTEHIERQGQRIQLPQFPAKLLKRLMQKSPNVVSRETLENALWPDGAPDQDVLKIHIHTLRQKIDKPFNEQYLKTVRGTGYQLMDCND